MIRSRDDVSNGKTELVKAKTSTNPADCIVLATCTGKKQCSDVSRRSTRGRSMLWGIVHSVNLTNFWTSKLHFRLLLC